MSLCSTTFTAATLAHPYETIDQFLLGYGPFILLIARNPSVTNESFKPIPCNRNEQSYTVHKYEN
jgi:hypothetical protein